MRDHAGPGSALRLWQLAAAWPGLALLFVVIAQHAFGLGAKDLWYMDEARHGGVLFDLMEHGDWLALSLNGTLYPDKPPLYFWYLAGLSTLFGTSAPWVFQFGLAGTVWMMLWATQRLALKLTGEREVALAAALVLAGGVYFVAVTHYARMDMMFAAAIALSWMHVFLATRDTSDIRRGHMLAGFAFAALAAMIKGPVGLMFPILALVGILIWQRRPGALIDRSVLGGLLIVVAVVGAWAGGIVAIAGPDYFGYLFQTQIVDRGLNNGGWLGAARYLVTFPLVLLPWTFLALVGRGEPGRERAFLWLATLLGLAALSAVSEKHEYYLLPLMIPVSILAARCYLGLPPGRLALFWTLSAVFLALLGAVFLGAAAGLLPATLELSDYRALLPALAFPGMVLVAGALVIWSLRRRARAALVALVAVQAAFVAAGVPRLMPALDAILSPATVATAMAPHVASGHAPAALGGEGVFAYYLEAHYFDAPYGGALKAWLEETPRAVAAIPRWVWEGEGMAVPGAAPVDCVRFAGQAVYIVLRPAPEDAAPGACAAGEALQ